MTRDFFGPLNLGVGSQSWTKLSDEQVELWKKNPVVMGLIDQNCLEIIASSPNPETEVVDTATIAAPKSLDKADKIENRGNAQIEIKKGGAK